jgi:hypothetical protein
MSRVTVEQLIGRLVIDETFRDALTANPQAALGGYDLSDAERAALVGMDWSDIGLAARELDVRISKNKAGEAKEKFFGFA